MSRAYGMNVTISGYDPGRTSVIEQAAQGVWPLGDWYADMDGGLTAYGEGHLSAGTTEEQFVERLSVAVWRANGGFCEVTVDATCLEDLPFDVYCLDEDDYERLMHKAASTRPE